MVYYMEIKGTMVSGDSFITYKNLGEIGNPEDFTEDEYVDLYEEIKNIGFIKIPTDDTVKFFDTKMTESIELLGPLNQEEALDRLAYHRENMK